MGAHFGDGFKVGSMVILNNFMSIPYYSLPYNSIPCFVHSIETPTIRGIQGETGEDLVYDYDICETRDQVANMFMNC
jgi:hypothetical protein